MDAQQLVDRINLRHGTRYTLHKRYMAGENQGAYALTDEHGTAYVLKWNERPPWLDRVRHAQQITAYLRTLGTPADHKRFFGVSLSSTIVCDSCTALQ